MVIGIIPAIIILLVFLVPCIMEAISNIANPLPKMHDNNDERTIFTNILRTRDMFEILKK